MKRFVALAAASGVLLLVISGAAALPGKVRAGSKLNVCVQTSGSSENVGDLNVRFGSCGKGARYALPLRAVRGAKGIAGSQGAQGPAGANGAAGAKGDKGDKGDTGMNGTNGTNGTNGVNTLISTSAEPAGANCANGGTKVDSGLDNGDGGGTAGDNVLQSGEIDATSYTCNGADGATGPAGPNAPSFFVNPPGGFGQTGSRTVTQSGYTLTVSCSHTDPTTTITITLSRSGQFNIAGGGIKGTTPYSFEGDGFKGGSSSYTIVSDNINDTPGDGTGQVDFEAGHFSTVPNIIGHVGWGTHFPTTPGLAVCIAFGSLEPTQ